MYDPNCWTYWCDHCGHEMTINYPKSKDDMVVLTCPNECESRTYILSTVEETNDGKG